MVQKVKQGKIKIFQPWVLILNVSGIILNIFFSMAIRETDLPFYLDTIGTLFVSALGGLIPGIVTALGTNLINFFMDGESIYYASLNMIIAVMAAVFFHSENKKKPVLRHVLLVLAMALVGGGLGSQITMFLYGIGSDSPMLSDITNGLMENLNLSPKVSFVSATFMTDLLDKTFSLLIAYLILFMVPKKVKEKVKLSHWYQTPLSSSDLKKYRKNVRPFSSIGVRMSTTLILSMVFTATIISLIGLVDYRRTAIDWLSQVAEQFSTLAAREIDPEMVDDYLKYGEEAPGYLETKERLEAIKDSSMDISFLYVYKVERDGCHVVFDIDSYLPDGTYVEGDPPGLVVGYENAYFPFIDDMLLGRTVPPLLMQDFYGQFVTTAIPVFDADHDCVCYTITNVRLDSVYAYTRPFITRVLILFSGFFILTVVIAVWITRYRVIMPIVSMTQYANEFVAHNDTDEESLKKIEALNIVTGDEVELLYKAICKMTGDTVAQMNDIRAKSESIAKLQNGLIITMADMVESRDSDTGAHIQKTAAYVRIILQGLKKNGYYIEKLTDKYMNDVEMSAPLHDVGKIRIPDAILNKPGKLTPEEFEIMKSHTIAGKNFLENAISTVEGDNYLKEARNMAAYHHERWDGTGYPEGLHGQVIPLSARIMAVADVFDALVSPRIYKPAYPLDEAVEIIRESAGKQFDPKVVEVFLEALPEIKKIMNKYKEA
ncbi:MAG: HD domain-containing protein [Lachnospiraceae bacterium]|nr:HD domain-containing protein [Lachnospiraceae bacterium]